VTAPRSELLHVAEKIDRPWLVPVAPVCADVLLLMPLPVEARSGPPGQRPQGSMPRSPELSRRTRIVYPADKAPELVLPDGSRRVVRSLLKARGPLRHGDFIWHDEGVPSGRVWVRVDLGHQLLSVFRAGHEIGTAVILYGTRLKPTPPGIYPIMARARHHRSNLYDAEMPFMLRLTNDGVAIHASDVRARAATHGCIGLPSAFARRLFEQARRGDLVIIEGVTSLSPQA